MLHKVRCDGVEPVITGDQVVFPGELALDLPRLILVEVGILQQGIEFIPKRVVGELQLWDAVFVVERDRRTIRDGLGEVVDRDVVAKDLPGAFLASHERCSRETEKTRVRQRVPHVQREGVVLATVRLIGDHDDVPPVGQLWISRPVPRVELVDQREDEAVIAL